jgi:two-component system NtrC family response regulator
MPSARVIVLDADQGERSRLARALSDLGLEADEAGSPAEALLLAGGREAPAVLAVLREGGSGGLARTLRAACPGLALVVAADLDRFREAIEALAGGAESWLPVPVAAAHAAVALEKARETARLRAEEAELRERVRWSQTLVGTTPAVQLVHEVIRRAAPTKATVLVQGETGTGRELVARVLHDHSPRRDRPFVRMACAGLSEPLLESELFGHEAGVLPHAPWRRDGRVAAAEGGTLFLQEVAGLPSSIQVRLLRLLQHGEYERAGGTQAVLADVRVVASTTRDLAEEVRLGRLRDDLYYRLGVVSVALPLLRERRGDIPALVEHFLEREVRAGGKDIRGISPGALSALYAYEWPGNVRELATEVARAVERCDAREIGSHHLSPALQGAGEDRAGSALIPGATLDEIEREAILRTLEEVGGSTARAAQILGISVRKIQYKLKEYRGGNLARRRQAGVVPLHRAAGD